MQPRARIFRADDAVRHEDEGIVLEILPPKVTGARDLWFGRFTSGPGFAVPPHHHTSDTVAYLISGRARFEIGDDLAEVVEMTPGEYVFVPAGVVHTEATVGDEDAEFIIARDQRGGDTIYRD
jgi:uncharacterized RmlC-like cupin family protein